MMLALSHWLKRWVVVHKIAEDVQLEEAVKTKVEKQAKAFK